MLIEDIEYVIFRHPDLDLQQGGDSLYLRSYGDAPFSYVSTQGKAAFAGVGFRVNSREALDTLATRFGLGRDRLPASWRRPVHGGGRSRRLPHGALRGRRPRQQQLADPELSVRPRNVAAMGPGFPGSLNHQT
ncbi:hypothetical protein M3I53_18250 [Paraburkholderia sp. CNPSo 3272]|uniref:hypothetical protein n=1 Tax=Paraburkholderia sp. CNPSo 3272 TaxID=2940931 RepID=UPI0020B7BE2C|nr:hypothetical protein [Paraburkholderia sp. CNPSo 3272]MCP3725043.1 hypothetical protein [Paraburkholderia sp. CNPSo 3272]